MLALDRVSKFTAHEIIVSGYPTDTHPISVIDFGLSHYPNEGIITYHPILNSGVAFGVELPRVLLITLTI